jgi:hypothetical protein
MPKRSAVCVCVRERERERERESEREREIVREHVRVFSRTCAWSQ